VTHSHQKTLITTGLALVMAGCSLPQTGKTLQLDSPGTTDRPVLTMKEAAIYTPEAYFAYRGQYSDPIYDPWHPQPIQMNDTNFIVGPQIGVNGARFTSIQAAVNAVIAENTSVPKFIKILPGRYVGTVYIPSTTPPITIYGSGNKPDEVIVSLALDSMISPAQYRQTVNGEGQYQPQDPAWNMYHICATKMNATINTSCSAVIWSQSDRFQMKNLTVENSLLDQIGRGTHQGVALRTDGDRMQLENVRLLGRQDTFFVNTSNAQNEYVTDHYSRAYIKDSYIEGDVDYVFGRANAVFENVHFHSVTSRGPGEAFVFAPDTMPGVPHGFLVTRSRITGDAGFQGKLKAKLGRAWDQGASKTGYLPGKTANGQLVIRESWIDSSYDLKQPWAAAATTSRPHRGNANPERDLNDLHFNRLWEYQNKVMVK